MSHETTRTHRREGNTARQTPTFFSIGRILIGTQFLVEQSLKTEWGHRVQHLDGFMFLTLVPSKFFRNTSNPEEAAHALVAATNDVSQGRSMNGHSDLATTSLKPRNGGHKRYISMGIPTLKQVAQKDVVDVNTALGELRETESGLLLPESVEDKLETAHSNLYVFRNGKDNIAPGTMRQLSSHAAASRPELVAASGLMVIHHHQV